MTFAQTRTLLDDFPFGAKVLGVPAPNETLVAVSENALRADEREKRVRHGRRETPPIEPVCIETDLGLGIEVR